MNWDLVVFVAIFVLCAAALFSGPELAVLLIGAMLWIGATIWCAADAERRGKPGGLVGLFVLLFPLFGLLAWLIFRPDVPGESGTGPDGEAGQETSTK